MKTIFISYAWESDEHQEWVKQFARDLERLGDFEVLLDKFMPPGFNLIHFMRDGIPISDKVLIIGTPTYKKKSVTPGKGTAYEGAIISSKMARDIVTTKFIPILRSGSFETSFPDDISWNIGFDFTKENEQKYNENLKELADNISNERPLPKSFEKLYGRTSSSTSSEVSQKPDSLTFTVEGVPFKMIRVEGGTFTMGADENDEEADSDERLAHQVTLSPYYIGETVVTQSLWKAVMKRNYKDKATPSRFKGDNRPVECVSWDDCQLFIKELNAITKRKFCLPSEAQWEFAARGGNKSHRYKYSGSDNLDKIAWFGTNSRGHTHDVKTLDPNELGLYDMSGNVWEWCEDVYDEYGSSPQTDPLVRNSGSLRVIRGGGWYDVARNCRSSFRGYCGPGYCIFDLGLRLVLSE